MSRGNAQKRTLVRPIVGFVRRHPVAIGELPVDLRMKIGERIADIAVEFTHTRFV